MAGRQILLGALSLAGTPTPAAAIVETIVAWPLRGSIKRLKKLGGLSAELPATGQSGRMLVPNRRFAVYKYWGIEFAQWTRHFQPARGVLMADRSKNDGDALIFCLAYCSRAMPNLAIADLDNIISAARLKNSRENITGWLVCGSGVFFQWLEGGREDVKRLMDSIRADVRHNTIVVLSESEEVRERLFGEWDMELVSAEDIREVLLDAMSEATDAKNLEALRTLVKEVDSRGLKPGLMNNLIDL